MSFLRRGVESTLAQRRPGVVRWCLVQCRGVLLVRQGYTALAEGGGCLDIFLSSIISLSFLPLWETARYRLKYSLKGPLDPKQPTNQSTPTHRCVRVGMVWTFLLSSILSPLSPSLWETARYRLKYCLKGPLNPKQPTNSQMCACGRPRYVVDGIV